MPAHIGTSPINSTIEKNVSLAIYVMGKHDRICMLMKNLLHFYEDFVALLVFHKRIPYNKTNKGGETMKKKNRRLRIMMAVLFLGLSGVLMFSLYSFSAENGFQS